jgi:hypothetical protein
MAPKRKHVFIEDEDVNDGSDSDQSQDGYAPHARGQRVEQVQHQAIRISFTGRVTSSVNTIAAPASPSKRSQIPRPPFRPPPDKLRVDWESEYAEFDAEYGPGLEQDPQELRDSVRR